MKILLEQVITGDTEQRVTLIDSTIDSEGDAQMAFEAVCSFDNLLICSGYFTDNDHIRLDINGEDIGYAQLDSWEDLIVFLGGEVNARQEAAEGEAT